MIVQEIWSPKRMTASGTLVPLNGVIGHFICTTAGTLQITVGETSGGADIVSSFSVAAGTIYPIMFRANQGAYAVLGGGAVGTFGVSA